MFRKTAVLAKERQIHVLILCEFGIYAGSTQTEIIGCHWAYQPGASNVEARPYYSRDTPRPLSSFASLF